MCWLAVLHALYALHVQENGFGTLGIPEDELADALESLDLLAIQTASSIP